MASGGSGVKQDAFNSYGANSGAAAQSLATLSPIYQQMATNPQGFTPQQKADMLTSSAQSLGGGVGAAVGQNALAAARTGNIGGNPLALDDASRSAAATESGNALGVENQSALLSRQQQEEGLNGLSDIYKTSDSNAISSLNTANQAAKPFWQSLLLQGMQSAGQAATGALA